jgi:D-serine deaminase-like pyridoxal phosphate-dependent protein
MPSDLDRVPTPTLIVDEALVRQNVVAMGERVHGLRPALWPHAKTHKSIELGRMQRGVGGAVGFTMSTLHEAEVFTAAGLGPLTLAQPPVGGWRIARLLELTREGSLTVALDSVAVGVDLDRACRAERRSAASAVGSRYRRSAARDTTR